MIVVNARTGEWQIDGREQSPLTCKLAMILSLLVDNPGRIVTFEVFRDEVWGGRILDANNLRQHITHLRKKLRSANAPVEVQGFSGRGWRLVETQP